MIAPPRALTGLRFGALVAAVVATLAVPYLYHWARTPAGLRYHGCDYVNLGDLYSYAAWMKQAQMGHLLFVNLYDPAPQPRTLFLPLFLVLGNVARLTGLDLLLTLHLARVAASVALLCAARWFTRTLAADPGEHLRSFLLLALGTGLPALVPEASPISSMYDHAHHTVGWTILLIGAGNWLGAILEGATRRRVLATGAAASLLFVVHPFEAVSLLAMVVATTLAMLATEARGRVATAAAAVAVLAAPGAAIVAVSLAGNPAVAGWARAPRPAAGWELLSFGTITLLALAALLAPTSRRLALLWCWVGTGLLLMFGPMPSGRRYVQGLQAPLALLAATGFSVLVRREWRRTAALLMAAAFPVAILIPLIDLTSLVPTPRYIDAALIDDLRTLESLPPGAVFTSPSIGYFIPPFAGRGVYAGHFEATPDFELRRDTYQRFERGDRAAADLHGLGVRYVLLASHVPERHDPGLRLIRTLSRARLYELVPRAPIDVRP